MSDTVTVFDPQGVARDIPYDMLKQAVSSGGKPAVRMQAPDGKVRVIPADKMQEAAQAGGKVLPLEQQETQQPGFWHSLVSDLGGMLKPSGISPYPGMDVDAKQALLQQGQQQDQSRQQAGYSTPYRVLAAGANGLGINAAGMEQSAAQGDEAGVYGHAAAPVAAIGAGELAAHVVPKAVPPVVRGTVKAANAILERAPGVVGGAIGAGIGGTVAGTVGAEVGGTAGAVLGKDLFRGVKIPGENFGIKPPPVPQIPEGPAPLMGAADAMALKKSDPAAFALRQQQIAKYGVESRPTGKPQINGPTERYPNQAPAQQAPAPNDQVTPNATVLRTKGTPQPPMDPAVLAKQAEALRGSTKDTVSQALPDASKGVQLRTQAQVDFYLKKGNLEAAQKALDDATGQKSNFPPPGPSPSKTTNEIRDMQPEAQKRRFADTRDDAGVSQEANWDLQNHGYMAESEARKEFIARNSTGVTKGDLVRKAGGVMPADKSAAPTDLTDILQKSLDEVKRRKQAGK